MRRLLLTLLFVLLLTDLSFAQGAVFGTVTGPSGVISGVTVTLGGAATGTTTTGADGKYSFFSLSPGDYTVAISDTGLDLPISTLSRTLTEGFSAQVDFDLTYTVKGTVRDSRSDEPVSGATVELMTAGQTATMQSDANGAFEFSNLPTVSVKVNYYVPTSKTFPEGYSIIDFTEKVSDKIYYLNYANPQVLASSVDKTKAKPGDMLSVTLQLGEEDDDDRAIVDGAPDFNLNVYLTKKRVLKKKDILLGTIAVSDYGKDGVFPEVTGEFEIPKKAKGKKLFVTVQVDPDKAIEEGSEGDNIFVRSHKIKVAGKSKKKKKKKKK